MPRDIESKECAWDNNVEIREFNCNVFRGGVVEINAIVFNGTYFYDRDDRIG